MTHFYRRDVPRALFSAPAATLVIVALMAAYVAGYAWSAPNTDSADELMRAYEIRHAIAFPLEGPPLGGVLHIGPAWFYLAAAPLFAWHSWLAVALFIGFVCSLKFPLAWWCGRRLLDGDFGVFWAVALFLPGWPTIEQLVFLNPNAIAMALLACLAIALPGLERPAGSARFFTLGLALALAFHVHPTSLPAFVLAPAMLWRLRRDREPIGHAVGALVLGFALPFVPYVVKQALTGFPDWGSASGYVAGQIFAANIVNAPAVIAAYLLAGPATMARFLLEWPAAYADALGIAVAILAAMSITAAVHGPLATRRLLQSLAALALIAAWIACARPTTPVQFTWALAAPIGALAGLGLWGVSRRGNSLVLVAFAAAATIVAVNLLVVRALALMVRDGEGRLPSLIMDIKAGLPPAIYRDVWFPAYKHDELGEALCTGARPASLHGHLAYVIDKDLALDTLLACNDRSGWTLAGNAGSHHHLGMTRPFWRAISARPDCWIGSLGLAGATPLAPRAPIAIADGATYLPRKPSRRPVATHAIEVDAPPGRAVLLTNVLGGYEHFQVLSAQAGGQPARPAATNDLSALYAAPAGEVPVRWRFEVSTTHIDAVDVVAVSPRPGSLREPARCLSP